MVIMRKRTLTCDTEKPLLTCWCLSIIIGIRIVLHLNILFHCYHDFTIYLSYISDIHVAIFCFEKIGIFSEVVIRSLDLLVSELGFLNSFLSLEPYAVLKWFARHTWKTC